MEILFWKNDSYLNKSNTPKVLNTEDDILINSAQTENPAETVALKIQEKWQQSDINTSVENKAIDFFDIDNEADLRTWVIDINGDLTSLILSGKLKEKLPQHYKELENKYAQIWWRTEWNNYNESDSNCICIFCIKNLSREIPFLNEK